MFGIEMSEAAQWRSRAARMFESNVIALPSPFALGRTVVGIRGVLSSPSDEIYAPFIGVIQTGVTIIGAPATADAFMCRAV